jgi:hypothetical protein
MIEEMKLKLADLGLVLELKQDDMIDLFDSDELQAYFRTRDLIKLLIPTLTELEQALYKNKVLVIKALLS